MTTRIAVLFSGGGRTVLNLLDKIDDGVLDAGITLAIDVGNQTRTFLIRSLF